MTNKAFVPSQMYRELQSIIGMNPFLDCNSASRIQMYGSHLGQKLVIAGLEEPLQTTGMNIEFGKYTFSVDMPANALLKILIKADKKSDENHRVKMINSSWHLPSEQIK